MQKLLYVLPIILILLLGGCNVCFAPGAGYNVQSTDVSVPVVVEGAKANDPSTLWVNSGIEIELDETIPLSVNGAVNFCEDVVSSDDCTNAINCRRVLLPGFTCGDGSIPQYKRDLTGENQQLNFPDEVCPNGQFRKQGDYIDTGLTVNPGDTVIFNLVPAASITINDCKNLPKGVSTFKGCTNEKKCIDPGDCFVHPNTNQCVDPVKLCESGLDVTIHGTSIKIPSVQGRTFTSIIDNDFTPYSNKMSFIPIIPKSSFPDDYLFFAKGALIDLRQHFLPPLTRKEYNYPCNDVSSSNSGRINVGPELKKFNAYDVLYRCNLIFHPKLGWFKHIYGDSTTIASIQYNFIASNGLEENRIIDYSSPSISSATHVIAKLGGGTEYNSNGDLCLIGNIKNTACLNVIGMQEKGLKLNYPYLVPDEINLNTKLYLSNGRRATNALTLSLGGFHVEVKKTCIKENGKGLYMYIGDSAPSIRPGEDNTYSLERALVTSPNGVTTIPRFEINKDNPPRSGKIYFAIKDAEYSDTFTKIKKSSPDNHYTATIIKPKFFPRFSEPFNKLIQVITEILYGTSANDPGIIRIMYTNFTGGSNYNAIQAVLMLYVALYGVMFALGLIEHPQVDFATRIIKICCIMALFSTQSWELFGNTLYSMFIQGSKFLIGAFSGVLDTNNNSFEFFDLTFGTLLTSETWLRFLSLIFSGPAGFMAFLLVIWGVALFAVAFLEAIIAYVMTIIALSLMFVLAPIFITFILFNKTRNLFDGWIKLLVSFALRPVFMFAGLAFLNQILLSTFYAINNFGVCTRSCWLQITLFGEGEKAEGICFFDAIVPMGFSQTDSISDRIRQSTQDIPGMGFMGLPFTVSSLIAFLIVANLMKVFTAMSESIVQAITGTMASMMEAGRSASQALFSVFGKDEETKHAIKNAKKSTNKGRQNIEFKAAHDEKGNVKPNDVKINKEDAPNNIINSAPSIPDTDGGTKNRLQNLALDSSDSSEREDSHRQRIAGIGSGINPDDSSSTDSISRRGSVSSIDSSTTDQSTIVDGQATSQAEVQPKQISNASSGAESDDSQQPRDRTQEDSQPKIKKQGSVQRKGLQSHSSDGNSSDEE